MKTLSKKNLTELKTSLDSILMEYIKRFEKKQDIEFEHAIRDNLLDVLCFGYYFFNIDDIIHDLETKQKKGLILTWHEETTDYMVAIKGSGHINYKSYCVGFRYEDLKLNKE